jgi:hypothetical protein
MVDEVPLSKNDLSFLTSAVRGNEQTKAMRRLAFAPQFQKRP